MTQVLLVVVAVLALSVVTLAVLVIRLRTEVRELSAPAESGRGRRAPGEAAEVIEGIGRRGTRRAVEERSDRPESPRWPSPEPTGARDGAVAVITQLSDTETSAVDLTTARIAAVTLGRPLIKTTAFAYGVRRALDDEHRLRITLAFRRELRRQRKLRRRRGRTAAVREAAP